MASTCTTTTTTRTRTRTTTATTTTPTTTTTTTTTQNLEESLAEEEFEVCRAGILSELKQKPKNLGEERGYRQSRTPH